jgi:hypothetical protein
LPKSSAGYFGIRDFELYLLEGSTQNQADIDMTSQDWTYTAWGGNAFTTTQGWTIVGGTKNTAYNDYISNCGSDKMVGGINVFSSGSSLVNTITLSPHYYITVKVEFFKLGTWSANDIFTLTIDGNVAITWTYPGVNSNEVELCGSTGATSSEQIVDLSGGA